MKTRFSSLVNLKKSTMQKSERVVQKANVDLNSAIEALEIAYISLGDIDTPSSGSIAELLSSRTLLSSQRDFIEHNKEWVNFAKNQLNNVKEQLKKDTIEYEKFNYLEVEEIKKVLKKRKLQEAKDLDEVALMTYKKEV